MFVFTARPLPALDDWPAISQDELKLAVDPAHPADAIILDHEETSDDNRNHRLVYKRIKIFTEKGRQWADVVIPYVGTSFHVIDVKGRTIAPDGAITPYTGRVFEKTIVKGQGVKFLAKSFALPNAHPGCIIEFRYTEYWDDQSAYAPHWTLQQELQQKHAKFTFIPYGGSGEVVDKRGNALNVYYATVGLPSDAAVKQVNGRNLQLEIKDVPAFQEEEFAPPSGMMKWRVNFYYGTGKMAKPAEFWKEEGKYWTKEVERFIGHSSAVAAAANQLVAASDTPEQKLRKVYAHVEKIKNLSYENDGDDFLDLFKAEKEGKITAEDILKRNAGKRDHITRLFVAMVRALNLPAYVMRVGPRDEIFFQQNLPDWRQLNSEIAVVTGPDGKELFLDPGTRFCPFGILDWRHTGVRGVRQTADGNTDFQDTPPPDYSKTLTLRAAALILTSDGNASGTVRLSWTGQEALGRRNNAGHTDEAGRKKDLEDELRALMPNGSVAQMESSAGWDTPDAPLTATFKVQIPSFASVTGKRLLFPSGFFQANSPALFSRSERKSPVYLSYPYRTIDDLQITLPTDYKTEDLPQTAPIRTDFSIYKVERTASGNTLHIRRDFAIAGIAYQVEEYPKIKTLFSGIRNGDTQQVVLTAAK
jgi:hypothetical protein